MEILVRRVDPEEIPYLIDLAPYYVLSDALNRDVFSFVSYKYEDEKKTNTGFVQYIQEGKYFRLLYLYVAVPFRGNGVGAELIKNYKEKAAAENAKTLECLLDDNDMIDVSASDMAEFLLKQGFEDRKDCEAPLHIEGAQLICSEFFRKSFYLEAPKGVISFEDITNKEINDAVKELDIEDKRQVLLANKKLSFLHETKDGCDGMMVVRSAVDRHYPMCFAKDEDIRDKFLQALMRALAKHMRLSDILVVKGLDEQKQLFKKYFPETLERRAIIVSAKI